jgi:hypothetical protein
MEHNAFIKREKSDNFLFLSDKQTITGLEIDDNNEEYISTYSNHWDRDVDCAGFSA